MGVEISIRGTADKLVSIWHRLPHFTLIRGIFDSGPRARVPSSVILPVSRLLVLIVVGSKQDNGT